MALLDMTRHFGLKHSAPFEWNLWRGLSTAAGLRTERDAVQRGNHATAVRHLALAGITPGRAQIGSFKHCDLHRLMLCRCNLHGSSMKRYYL